MKITIKCIVAALLLCCNNIFTSCNKRENTNSVPQMVRTELLRTTQSWNGEELPDYPQGRPELVAVKYEIPVGEKLGWHHHIAMNHGVLVQGELTIIGLDGQTITLQEGDVVVEMVNSIHYGENRGRKPVVLYMFYLSQEGLPLSVPNSIPIE